MARVRNSVDLARATGYQVVSVCKDALLLANHGSQSSDLEREIDCRKTQLWYSGSAIYCPSDNGHHCWEAMLLIYVPHRYALMLSEPVDGVDH
jgi:hypothetical protein